MPLAAADSTRLQEAASLRGPGAAPVTRAALARRLVAGSLDRSVDVAATLELRGFGLGTRPARVRYRRQAGEVAMLVAGLGMIAASVAAAVSGWGEIQIYPTISGGLEPGTLAFALALPLLAALPVLLAARARSPAWRAPARTGARRMSAPVLSCAGLEYTYPGAAAPAVGPLDLEFGEGAFVVLAGRSGSGKSTLLRAACGLVPHFHGGRFAGDVIVDGRSTREAGPAELAVNVGFVAQEPESQVVSTTVRAELELPLELRGRRAAETARAVEEVALALGVEGLLERTTDTLSGGELQRVAIGAALVMRPPLLLLDEPTSQLDPVAGDELIALLRRLNEEWGVTVVLGEHRLERCLPAADRVVALEAGRIAFDGPPGGFGAFATARAPWLATPGMTMFELAGLEGRPTSVKEARGMLAAGHRVGCSRPRSTGERHGGSRGRAAGAPRPGPARRARSRQRPARGPRRRRPAHRGG